MCKYCYPCGEVRMTRIDPCRDISHSKDGVMLSVRIPCPYCDNPEYYAWQRKYKDNWHRM